MDQAVAAISEQIRAAASDRSPLRVRAGGSKDFYGNTPHGALLDPRAVRGIVAYDPSELSIAVRCGTPLAQLEAALEERGQRLRVLVEARDRRVDRLADRGLALQELVEDVVDDGAITMPALDAVDIERGG